MAEVLDYILVAFIALVIPVQGFFETRSFREKVSKNAEVLSRMYRQTIILLWSVAVAVLVLWAWSARPFDELGLSASPGFALFVTLGFVVATVAGLFLQARNAGNSKSNAQAIMQQLQSAEGVLALMPTTKNQYRLFQKVSITAGITEEIIYRGYLIWFFSLFFPLIVAATLSLAVFAAAHFYQRSAKAVVQVLGVGLVLTLVYLLSGSLLPAIVLHMAIDLAMNSTIWRARSVAAG